MDGKKNQEIDSQVISLLEEIREIHDGYLCTGQSFNLFDLFHAEGNEVRVCSVMRDLLDPKGSHGQGTIYLDLFLRMVLDMQIIPMNPVRIWQEFRIQDVLCTAQENRRIDLVIQAKNCFIAIEVKIYANDQEGQCYDYFQEVERHCKDYFECDGLHEAVEPFHGRLYYLSRYGALPEEKSLVSNPNVLKANNIHCISFKYDIMKWLKACLQITQDRSAVSMAVMFRQFIGAVRRWTGEMDEETMDLKRLLLSHPQTLLLASKIEKSFIEIKKELLPRIMKKFEEKLECYMEFPYRLDRKSTTDDVLIGMKFYDVLNNLQDFYNSPDSGEHSVRIGMYWPILCEKEIEENYKLYFSIEVEWNLYAQCLVYDKKKNEFWPVQDEKNESMVDDQSFKKNYSEYVYLPLLPYTEKTDLKHYQNMDEEMLTLFKDDVLDEVVASNMERIKKLLERVKRKVAVLGEEENG